MKLIFKICISILEKSVGYTHYIMEIKINIVELASELALDKLTEEVMSNNKSLTEEDVERVRSGGHRRLPIQKFRRTFLSLPVLSGLSTLYVLLTPGSNLSLLLVFWEGIAHVPVFILVPRQQLAKSPVFVLEFSNGVGFPEKVLVSDL